MQSVKIENVKKNLLKIAQFIEKILTFRFLHFKKCQSKAIQPLNETMKVQIVFCCVAILCCWNGKATSSNGCKFAFSVLLTISFKCLTTITRNTWVYYCFALMKKLKMSAKCIPSQIELSNQNISSGREDLLDFLTIFWKNIWNIYGDFQYKFFPISKIHTDRQTLHTIYICMIHLYLQQNNLKFAVRARRWHAVVVGWEKYCLNNLARELTTCLRSGG